jgi:hypothetical protein
MGGDGAVSIILHKMGHEWLAESPIFTILLIVIMMDDGEARISGADDFPTGKNERGARPTMSTKEPDMIAKMADRLQSGEVLDRLRAVSILGMSGDGAAVGPLAQALQDINTEVRQNAAQALGRLGDAAGGTALLEALDDRRAAVRLRAAESLGLLREKNAVPRLVELLEDRSSTLIGRVCDAAAEALDAIGTPDATKALKKWRKGN